MAGVKGRSGGKRDGAGRKAKPAAVLPDALIASKTESGTFDPRPTLEMVAKGLLEVSVSQQKALTALLPYVHAKKGGAGAKPEAPGKPAAGRYGVRQGPRLAAAGGKQV
jgi:hypothetical protein